MAQKITVNDGDIVVDQQRFEFGLRAYRSVGQVVTVLDRYTMARFNRADGTAVYREICGTCGGSGFRPEFAGVFGGQCFPCMGRGLGRRTADGTALTLVRTLRRREADKARRDAKRVTQEATRRAEHAEWLAQRPELAASIAAVCADLDTANPHDRTFSGLAADLAATGSNRILSQAQIDLFERTFAQDRQEKADREAAAAARGWLGGKGERITFTGKLVYIRHSTKEIGYGREVCTTLHIFTTDTGDTVKWWRSGYYDPALFERYTVKGTVNKLETSDKYGKATVITRGVVLDVQEEVRQTKQAEEMAAV